MYSFLLLYLFLFNACLQISRETESNVDLVIGFQYQSRFDLWNMYDFFVSIWINYQFFNIFFRFYLFVEEI